MARLSMLPGRVASLRSGLAKLGAEEVRGSAYARGYDAAWRKLRASILQAEPLCRRCAAEGRTRAAEEVHHQQPIAEAPARRLDPTNLEPLCKPCHSAETAGATWRGRGGENL